MRLQRRGLITAYLKVPELSKNGKQHLHILIRGEYITQAYISELWQEIHKAKVVDIRRTHKDASKAQLANYMAKYLAKENFFRYSWSWTWVWKGFCRDWTRFKSLWGRLNDVAPFRPFSKLLFLWRYYLKLNEPLVFRDFLDYIEGFCLPIRR